MAVLKYVLLLLIFLSSFQSSNAQRYRDNSNGEYKPVPPMYNEFKVNLAYIPFGYIELSYERLLKKNTSVGISYGDALSDDIDIRFHLLGFYRAFFSSKKGKGFFIEFNSGFWNEEDYRDNIVKHAGIGFAVGGKFFRNDKFHGECIFGIGKTLNENSFATFNESYPRFAINLGTRF